MVWIPKEPQYKPKPPKPNNTPTNIPTTSINISIDVLADMRKESERMKAIIHYSGIYEDELTVEADTFEELKQTALAESRRRGWADEDCWGEVTER